MDTAYERGRRRHLQRRFSMNLTDRYLWDETDGQKLADFSTNGKKDDVERDALYKKEQKNRVKIRDLQRRLYADQREGLIVIIVGAEASGKDYVIRKLVRALDPQGINVERYRRPGRAEMKHDPLWKVHGSMPERGEISILSGSYYEDLLSYEVKGEDEPLRVASRIDTKNLTEKYLRFVREFEEYLYGNSFRVVKIYLNLSLKKQKKRLIERFGNPGKNWNLGPEVLDDRMQWFEYQKSAEKIIKATATERNPWYVIPADRKWYANYLVSEVVLKILEEMDPHFPPTESKEGFSAYREALLSGKFDRKAILGRSKKKEEARAAAEKEKGADAPEAEEPDAAAVPVMQEGTPGAEEPNVAAVGAEETAAVETGAEEAVAVIDKEESTDITPVDEEDRTTAPAVEEAVSIDSEAPDNEDDDPNAVKNITLSPDSEETADAVPYVAEESSPAPEVTEDVADIRLAEEKVPATEKETAPESAAEEAAPAPVRRRTRKTTAEKESAASDSSAAKRTASAKKAASKTAGSAKKSSSEDKKENAGAAPKRRQTRKDGPPKTVGETLAKRARKRGEA